MNKRLVSLVAIIGFALCSSVGNPAFAEVGQGVKKAPYKKSATVHKKKVSYKKRDRAIAHRRNRQVAAVVSDPQRLVVQSSAVVVQDEATGAILFEKNADAVEIGRAHV